MIFWHNGLKLRLELWLVVGGSVLIPRLVFSFINGLSLFLAF
uniref:Uncharacterized protein n=1 Tax=Utricularia reniformis TaxID=192314 RepID=A0A1Y0B0E0_9LAMI|nr:hypothetical protein AEK19_MT0585 [Utricularia reniformis]ART30841.1 hypothetical protein AEK19_MT0585 [Utricularia reniformis]